MTETQRIESALNLARSYGSIDGDHHKMWVIDQMVRALTGCPVEEKSAVDSRGQSYTYEAQGESEEYRRWVADTKAGNDGPETYEWDEGIAP